MAVFQIKLKGALWDNKEIKIGIDNIVNNKCKNQ